MGSNGSDWHRGFGNGGTADPIYQAELKTRYRWESPEYVPGEMRLDPNFVVTKPKTFNIAARAFNTLVKSSFYDTILNSYVFSKDEGYTFNLAYIPNSFEVKSVGLVDQKYMLALFDLGHAQGVGGDEWQHTPPRLYQ